MLEKLNRADVKRLFLVRPSSQLPTEVYKFVNVWMKMNLFSGLKSTKRQFLVNLIIDFLSFFFFFLPHFVDIYTRRHHTVTCSTSFPLRMLRCHRKSFTLYSGLVIGLKIYIFSFIRFVLTILSFFGLIFRCEWSCTNAVDSWMNNLESDWDDECAHDRAYAMTIVMATGSAVVPATTRPLNATQLCIVHIVAM